MSLRANDALAESLRALLAHAAAMASPHSLGGGHD